jgi:hypothetical protein
VSQKKLPKSRSIPEQGKVPRERADQETDTKPVWRLGRLDFDGPWCPKKMVEAPLLEVVQKLGQIETMSWVQIDSAGSHFIGVHKIIKDAKTRLVELKMDDLEELYSLRLTGIQRLWGIRERNVFRALWWDPGHEICPSVKKHT